MLSGFAQTFALIGAVPFGILAEKIDKSLCQVVAAIFAAAGYFLLSFIDKPTGAIIYVAVVIVGLGEIGMVVSSQVLLSTESPRDVRGALSGFWTLSGSLSILVVTKIGGMLYDVWKPSPFLMLAIVNSIVFIVGLIIVITTKKKDTEFTS